MERHASATNYENRLDLIVSDLIRLKIASDRLDY